MFQLTEDFTADVLRRARTCIEPLSASTLACRTGVPGKGSKAAMNAVTEIMNAEVAAGRASSREINGVTKYVGYNR